MAPLPRRECLDNRIRPSPLAEAYPGPGRRALTGDPTMGKVARRLFALCQGSQQVQGLPLLKPLD
jgi:hypothetical protein